MGEQTDNVFQQIEDYVTGGIARFVAFLFFLITLGAVYGYFIAQRGSDLQQYFLLAPAIIGVIAYYGRALSVTIFVILLLFVFL